jgi:hypothetical protein
MPSWTRITLGVLSAPLLVPATYAGIAWPTGGFFSAEIALRMGLFAYGAAIVAVPALLWLSRRGHVSLQSHAIAGFALGVAAGALATGTLNPFVNLQLSVFDGLCGAVAAAGFWAITRPDRPAS